MPSGKKFLLFLLILLALPFPAVLAPSSSSKAAYLQEKRDLWMITATFREEITTTLRDDWTFTQKIRPDELVRADHVTVKKVRRQTSNTTSAASVITIVENEAGGDVFVVYDQRPVSTTVIGHRTYTEELEQTEQVNDITAEGSEFRTIQDDIQFREGSVLLEYSPAGQYLSAQVEGRGNRRDTTRIFKGGAWKEYPRTTEVTDGFGVGCTAGKPGARVSKQGTTYQFSYSQKTSKTEKVGLTGEKTTTVWKFLNATIKPYTNFEVRIIWTRDKGDEDITGRTVEAAPGERILLKTRIVPEDKTARDGQWKLEGTRTDGISNYIKKYEASRTSGRVVGLESGDFKAASLQFYWTGGGSGEVLYSATVDDTPVTGHAGFTVRRPEVDVRVNAQAGTTLKPKLDKGAALDAEECWVTSAYTSGPSAGLQYDGIEFLAEPKSQGSRGEFQWVQLIRSTEVRSEDSRGALAIAKITAALDICYPHQAGPRAFDAPGFVVHSDEEGRGDVIHISMVQQSRSFLMFRPAGEGNEWVPLSFIDWEWRGAAQYDGSTKSWQKFAAGTEGPGNPQPQMTENYPEWEKNSGDESQWTDGGG
jgi:hypothetical protein